MAVRSAESAEQTTFDQGWDSPDEDYEESPQGHDPTSSDSSDPPVKPAEEASSEAKPPEKPAGEVKEVAGGTPPKEESTPPAEGSPTPEEGTDDPTGSDPPQGSEEGAEQSKTVEQELEALKTESAKELSDLRSEVGRLRREKRQPESSPQPKGEEKTKQFDMTAIKANLKPLREADEEFATAIEKSFDAFGEQIKSRDSEIAELKETVGQLSGDSADTQFFREVLKVHPEAKGISESKGFTEWLDKQPSYIQETARNGHSPDDAIHIITSYKSATGKVEKTPAPEPAPEPPQETAEDKARKAARRSTGVLPIRQSNSGVKSASAKTEDSFDAGWDAAESLDDDMNYEDQPQHISFGS